MPTSKAVSTSLLEGRVVTLERDVGHIEKQVDKIREEMATRGDIAAITSGLNTLATQAATAGKPNWQAISVLVAFLSVVGAVLYYPLNTTISEMKTAVGTLNEKAIPPARYEADMRRTLDSMKAIDDQVQFVRKSFLRVDDYEKLHKLLTARVDDAKARVDEIIVLMRGTAASLSRLDEQARSAEKMLDLHTNRINTLRDHLPTKP